MNSQNFNNFFNYKISSDDADSLSFLLRDYLKFQKEGYRCICIKDFVFFLHHSGLTENETLNLLFEAMYHVPRRDILYESSVKYEEFKNYEFGKLINSKRILLFKIFNEYNEEDFQRVVVRLTMTTEGQNDIPNDPFDCMESFLKIWNKDGKMMEKSFEYFKKYEPMTAIPDIISRYNSYDKSKNIELKVPNQSQSKDVIVTLQKGDELSEPKFLIKSEDGPKSCDYNGKECYSYPEQDKYKSFCIIFNIRDYQNRPRNGSEQDVEKIKSAFADLYFHVEVFVNLTKARMFEIVDIYSSQLEAGMEGAMFVCFILAHGEKDYIYDINEQLVDFRELSMRFSAKTCEAYRGKPKIFFIQACQGQNMQEGIPVSGMVTTDYSIPQIEQDGVIKAQLISYKKNEFVPEEADFIFGMSTVPNCVAFRAVKTGSWYIDELCKVITKHASTSHLFDILTMVTYEVSQKVYGQNFCQLPLICSTLMRKCYLKAPTNIL